MQRHLTLVMLALAVGLASPSGALAQQPSSKPKTALTAQTSQSSFYVATTIPYRPLPGHGIPLVQVRLNDHFVGTFLVDTGANASLLTQTAAAKLGLSPTLVVIQGHPYLLAGKQAASVTVSRMTIGKIIIRNKRFVVIKANQLSFLPGHPVDGLISMDILSSLAILFDYRHYRMKVWANGNLSPYIVQRTGFDTAALPIADDHGDGIYSVSVRFSSDAATTNERLVPDTGANMTIISYDLARRLKLEPQETEGIGTMAGISLTLNTGRVSALRLGNLTVKDVLVGYSNDDTQKNMPLLGLDILSRQRILLDYPARKIYIGR